jgi:hypothetical protein
MEVGEKAEELPVRPDERRAFPRYPVEEPDAIVVLNQGIGFRCSVLDVSALGCRLRTSPRFPGSAWDRVEVSFKLCGTSMRFKGEIQWIDGRQKIGIRFLSLPARRRAELAEVLAEIMVQDRE